MPRRRHCPYCDAPLEPQAVLCIDCGYHFGEGRRLTTQSRRLARTFGMSPLHPVRLGAAVACAVAGLALCVLPLLAEVGPVPAFCGLALLAVALGLGFATRWIVTTSRRGEPLLLRELWLCYVPLPTRQVRLRQWDAVFSDYELVSDGRRQYEIFRLYLGLSDRSRFLLVYSGSDEGRMREMGDAIAEAAGLRWERM